MEFTGERVIPKLKDLNPLFEEHLARYMLAGEFVQGLTVLDLGCGTGYGTHHLSQRGARSVLGVDIDGETVGYARQHFQAPNLAFCQCDVLSLPFRRRTIDLVVSFEVIEHLRDAAAYLSAIRNVLTADGWYIGSTPNRLVHAPDAEKSDNPFHWREYDPTELEDLLRHHFDQVYILGQRPFQGFVIGPVAVHQADDPPAIEFLPENMPPEQSIAESKYLVYLAGNSKAEIDSLRPYLASHYYLGQPESQYDLLRTAYIRNLETYARSLESENRRLVTLLKGYQSGKFMRMMRAIHDWRSRISRQSP